MGKRRTKPSKEQAQYLYKYFDTYLTTYSRYSKNMTVEQSATAHSELARLNYFKDGLNEDLFDWSVKHIASPIYSNAIRAVNKQLVRLNSPVKGVKNVKKTTIEISRDNRYMLENLKEGRELPTYDAVITELLESMSGLNRLRLEGFKESNGLDSIDEAITMLLELEREVRNTG